MTQEIDIKAIRKELGLTQRELADKLDVTVKTVSAWETNTYRLHQASAKKLLRLLAKQRRVKEKEEK